MKPTQTLFVLLFSFPILCLSQPCREVVAYYPGWQWYDRAQLVNPLTIDYSQYTIINYAFFQPNSDGSISGLDPWADENLLLGQINWSTEPPSYYSNTGLVDLAHFNGLKILISVGGWTLSENFPTIAADETKRNQFATSCVELIEFYNLDGIDIDWEYPGFAEHNGTPVDEVNYVLLLQSVSTQLDSLENISGEEYIITAALPAGPSHMENIDWQNIEPLLDLMNIMTYDFNGTWNEECNHNAPLFEPTTSSPGFSTSSAIETLMNDYDMPAEKLVMGVPFYGRSMKTNGAPALFAPVLNGQADNTIFWVDEGSPLYYNVLLQSANFTEQWDAIAHVPYLSGNGALNTFVSFDNEQSITEKGNFISENNLAGAIIWELTGDYVETFPGSQIIAGTPLAEALNAALCSGPTCNGDFNSDNAVNTSDLLLFMSEYGCVEECSFDLNGDVPVNITDLLLFNALFGTVCP